MMPGFKTSVAKSIATFGGLGYIPKGPGTFGALGALFVAIILNNLVDNQDVFQIILACLIITSYIAGVISASMVEKEWGHDASKIVVDEAMGFWISIFYIPFSWPLWIAAFVLFRFFDILKPMGIRRLDQIKSPHGVMLDDMLAGVYSNLVMIIVLKLI
jgi:phosphatidylglycerophosphatase A